MSASSNTDTATRDEDPHRVLLTAEEAADRLSVSRSTVYDLIRTGELRSVKIGRARRVPASAIDDLVAHLLDDDTFRP